MILVDTREQKAGHVEEYFAASRIPFDRTKLYVGDYMKVGGTVSVDRKQNLNEWSMCLLGSSRRRFLDEVYRAKKAGIDLVVLIEHGDGIKTIQDVATWENPIREKHPEAVTGRALMEATYKFHIAYKLNIFFCEKDETGRRIVELLGGEKNG